MAKALEEIERGIRVLGPDERARLETSQRRYRELVDGKVRGVPGPLVFDWLRKRLGDR